MPSCIEHLKAGHAEKALEAFLQLSDEDKLALFRMLITYTSSPETLSVLQRKLKDGQTYEDFRNAWLPPKSATNPSEASLGYFDAPVRVLNFEREGDPSEILSLGLMWISLSDLPEVYSKYAETEQLRHERIAQVADKIGDTKIYQFKDSNDLGQ